MISEMQDDSFWGDKDERVERLASEVAELKGVLQDVSQQVRRIERNIRLMLYEQRGKKTCNSPVSRPNLHSKAQTLSESKARETIKRMTKELEVGKSIQAELRNMTMKHELTPIARVLGMTNTALPPKTELVLRIITRLRQTVMLTENIRKMPRVTKPHERREKQESKKQERDHAHN